MSLQEIEKRAGATLALFTCLAALQSISVLVYLMQSAMQFL